MNQEKSLAEIKNTLTNAITVLMKSNEEPYLNITSELVKALAIVNRLVESNFSSVAVAPKTEKNGHPVYNLAVTEDCCSITALGGLSELSYLIALGVSKTIFRLQESVPWPLKIDVADLVISSIREAIKLRKEEGEHNGC